MAGPPLINNRTERSRGPANREKGQKRRGGGGEGDEGERETETRVVLSSPRSPASPFSFPSSLSTSVQKGVRERERERGGG